MTMPAATLPAEFLLRIHEEIEINAPISVTFEALLEQIGPASEMMDGKPMPMKIEPWPGGRWFRDLGNNTGHLWGHVQVIKPPKLLEIWGPMAMSYAAVNHIQYRLTEQGNGTRLALLHRAMGEIPPEHRDGMPKGWEYILKKIRENAERRKGGASGQH
ncbi:MAG: SRPBCC family protein [Gemmataceae bacterium]